MAYDESVELTGTCNFLVLAPAVTSLFAEVRGSSDPVSTASNWHRVGRQSQVMEIKAMDAITSEHCAIDDVLSTLDLDPAVDVRIDIEETGVKLFIEEREYEWP